MFSEITMPEETEQKVLAAVSRRRKKPQTPFVRSIATLAAVLALVILVSPTARAALENWVVKYFFPGSDLTIYEQTDESGNVTGVVGVVDTEAPPFARLVNGRLYFLGNNERIDITEEITEEKEVVKDLGADSLDVVEMLMSLEEEFNITVPEEDAVNIKTVGDIVKLIENNN